MAKKKPVKAEEIELPEPAQTSVVEPVPETAEPKKPNILTYNLVEPDLVKSGDLMAFTYWAKVETNKGGGSLWLTDVDRKKGFSVVGNEMIQAAKSADFYSEEVKTSQTEIIQLLVVAYNLPFTVCFEKLDGTKRTLRGRLVQPDGLRGRSMVEDLDLSGPVRLRQVDHRTVIWLIINGIKYVVN